MFASPRSGLRARKVVHGHSDVFVEVHRCSEMFIHVRRASQSVPLM
jgi:hypothetical protein